MSQPFLTLDLDAHQERITFYRATLDPEDFAEGNLLNDYFEAFGSTPEEARYWLKQALQKHAQEKQPLGFNRQWLPLFHPHIKTSSVSLGDCFRTDKEQE